MNPKVEETDYRSDDEDQMQVEDNPVNFEQKAKTFSLKHHVALSKSNFVTKGEGNIKGHYSF